MTNVGKRLQPKTKELLGDMGMAHLLSSKHEPKFKLRVVQRLVDGREGRKPRIGVKRMADALGIARNTIWRWLKAYERDGKIALGVGDGPTRFKGAIPLPWKFEGQLTPRDYAVIRYGMPTFSNAEVAAFFGKTTAAIRDIRKGYRGPKLATPPVAPENVTLDEVNQWFIHKGIKLIEAYTEIVEKIEKGDPGVYQTLTTADAEPRPVRRARRKPERPAAGKRPGDRLEEAVRDADGNAAELRAIQAPDPRQLPSPDGAHRAGPSDTGLADGLIRRRRR